MKAHLFTTALLTSILPLTATASQQVTSPSPSHLLPRTIDPPTMNPTHLSLLSVLKTAIPTSPNTPMPTGTFEPEWYENLPADVKSLLPEFYPVTDGSGGGGDGDGDGDGDANETPTRTVETSGTTSSITDVRNASSGSATTTITTTPSSEPGPPNFSSDTTSSSASVSAAARTEGLDATAWLFCVGVGFFVFT